MEKRWVIKDADEDKVNSLQQDLKVHPVVCKLLVQRGIYTYEAARKFFRPVLTDLYNPFLMKDMQKAIDRINTAIANNERILIYGDYDVDGTTSVALAYSFFYSIYKNIDYYIPDRYLEGYGISTKGIDHAKQTECSLVIALDCGIKAVDKIAYANTLGVDFIICDHHIPGDEVPAAFAVLDPHQKDCNYPYKELSGCGIGFKLIQAYAQHHQIAIEKIIPYLDLVVVSIASDIVPITDENRVLAFFGIEQLNKNPRPGLKALIDISGYEGQLNISNIVFGLGPRINAAGRMDDANKAVRMLIAETVEMAKNGADVLHEKNVNRKEVDKMITGDALSMLHNDPDNDKYVTTVLCSNQWHKGVIGIVASRLIDHFYRPTILLTESEGMLYGSARSVKNFDIYEAIKACADLLEQFGGHMYAAGLSLKPENFEQFKQRFDDVVRANIKPWQLTPEIEIDAALNLKDITPTFNNIIKQFAPFGPQNMDPIFMSAQLLNNGRSRIVGDNHLKLGVKDNNRYNAEAIAFQKGAFFDAINNGARFDICYTIEENVYRDMKTIQLNVRDIKLN